MFPVIIGVVAVLLLVAVIIIAMQPADIRISRSLTMNAPPEAVFDRVNTLRNWEPWSPWAKMDPNAKLVYDGPASGVGSSMAWEGNKQVGQGKMTITESGPARLVRLRLEFLKPFKATNQAEFNFEPDTDGTRVTWSMACHRNFVFKAFGLLMNMDKMVGRDFEKGLASMKTLVEH